MDRFCRNQPAITKEQQEIIKNTKVLVIGLGGLGGCVCESLIRLGFHHFGICDFDLIEESNLNRQIVTTEKNIGKPKIKEMEKRLKEINSNVSIELYPEKFDFNNQKILNDLKNYDLIFDCLDNIPSRKFLQDEAINANVPIIYGAIANNYAYFGVITENNRLVDLHAELNHNQAPLLGSPIYTPAFAATMQVVLGLKYIFKQDYLKGGFYYVDLHDLTIEKIKF